MLAVCVCYVSTNRETSLKSLNSKGSKESKLYYILLLTETCSPSAR